MPGPVRSSGNVFLDLGYRPAEAELFRFTSRLLSALASYVAGFDTQAEAAETLGVSRPQVSEIKNGHLDKSRLISSSPTVIAPDSASPTSIWSPQTEQMALPPPG